MDGRVGLAKRSLLSWKVTSSSSCVSAYCDITKHTQQAHNALGHVHGRWQSESCLVSGLAGAQGWHRHGVFDELCTNETRTSGPAMCPAGTAKTLKPGHTHFTLTHFLQPAVAKLPWAKQYELCIRLHVCMCVSAQPSSHSSPSLALIKILKTL